MAKTKIEWTEYSWNPVTGCSPVSEGCQNCYARRMAKRLAGRCGYPKNNPFQVTLHPKQLWEPLKWKKPRRVFVCSMSDLFHENVFLETIADIWRTMWKCQRHTFIILTKRPERALKEWFYWAEQTGWPSVPEGWPLPNVWFGVSVENQQRADERIPLLLQIPAAVRFVSCEPLLGPISLGRYLPWTDYCLAHDCGDLDYPPSECPDCKHIRGIDWVIAGCESGPRRRPAETWWFRDLQNQCSAFGVPFFLKQMEVNGRVIKMPKLDGKVWDQMPKVS